MDYGIVEQVDVFEPWSYIRGHLTVDSVDCSGATPFAKPGLPENLLVESAVQLGTWLVMVSTNFEKSAVLTGIREFGFGRRPLPDEPLQIKVNVIRQDGPDIQLECDLSASRKFVARGKFTLETYEFTEEEAEQARFAWLELVG